jgi:hypothetical protein
VRKRRGVLEFLLGSRDDSPSSVVAVGPADVGCVDFSEEIVVIHPPGVVINRAGQSDDGTTAIEELDHHCHILIVEDYTGQRHVDRITGLTFIGDNPARPLDKEGDLHSQIFVAVNYEDAGPRGVTTIYPHTKRTFEGGVAVVRVYGAPREEPD